MTLDERIIDFLDGSLPSDDEAELLHTLSVSPEKRGVLRGFIDQRTLLARDAKSLSVPSDLDARLWARMETVLPSIPISAELPLAPIPVPVTSLGFLARAFSGASASIGALTLLTGLGIGYVAGHSDPVTIPTPHVASAPSSMANLVSPASSGPSFVEGNLKMLPALPLAALPLPAFLPIAPAEQHAAIPSAAFSISSISVPMPAVALSGIGSNGDAMPIFHPDGMEFDPESSFLSRIEFRLDESFGRQFPNTTATDVSMPIITNSSIAALFQILPHSDLLWAGMAYGSANVTLKNLYAKSDNALDPQQYELAADTSHSQTSYMAALAELRFPAFAATDIAFTGGYGFATLGQMMFGEIGLHYNVSSQAGIHCGLRVMRFTYNLNAEKASAINSGTSSFAISNTVAASAPSYNTELDAGLFFHF